MFDTCPQLVSNICSVQTDDKHPEMPEDGPNDHWIDSAMYACAYASVPDRIARPAYLDELESDDQFDEGWRADNGFGYGSTS